MLARSRGIEELTYLVPPELEGRVRPGHRVLAPLRSRKVTGVVLETAPSFPGTNGHLKPILELLEPRPLFDRAHLQMMEFLANYYMVPLAEVYRSVIPAVARVESRLMYKLAHAARFRCGRPRSPTPNEKSSSAREASDQLASDCASSDPSARSLRRLPL